MDAKELRDYMKRIADTEPDAQILAVTRNNYDTILRALSLLASVERTGEEIVRDLNDWWTRLRYEYPHAILMHDAAARIVSDAQEKERLRAELASVKAENEALRAYRLDAQSRESVEARFYRYLRNEAENDGDGPMVSHGYGDDFDFVAGEELDAIMREAVDRAAHPKGAQ